MSNDDGMTGLTQHLVARAMALGGFPSTARERALGGIVDCLGCIVAGGAEEVAAPLLSITPRRPHGPDHPALLFGTPAYATPAEAALCNGTLAHALDYDDTSHPALCHPSCVLVPALAAAAALSGASGHHLISAYIVGVELMGKLGKAMNPDHYKRGWHATSTFGSLAAALAAGLVLELSPRQLASAVGIAASAASGVRANFGTMVKPLHAGYAARNGILAAMLARGGMVASADSLEHPYGFLRAFNDGLRRQESFLLSFGSPLEILEPYGLGLKLYPSCGATQPGVEAAILLHRRIEGRAIRSVRIGVCEMTFEPLIYVMPQEPLQGKFSMQFCVAVGLLRGELNLQTFCERNVHDPAIRGLIERTEMFVDERWRKDTQHPTEITVTLEDGTTLREFVPLGIGKPSRWLTRQQQEQKFVDCASRVLAKDQAARAFAELQELDSGQPADVILRGALAGTA